MPPAERNALPAAERIALNDLLRHGLRESRAILEALPVGLVIYDEDRRLVLANRAYCEALGVPPDTFRPASALEDNLRLIACRGVFGPGDPEEQAASLAALDLTVARRIRRRHPDGRTFEAQYVPLGGGSHMVCVVDTTSLVAMRDEAETAVSRIHMAMASLRVGLAVFGPDRRLGLHNRRFTELLGLAAPSLAPGASFSDVLHLMQLREEYAGFEGDLFLAGQLSLDRSRPAGFRRMRANGQVIDVQSDPLPDGGWTMTVSDISALARAEDEARRRAGTLDSILRHIPHGIAVYGPDRRVTMLNAAYQEIKAGAPIEVGDALADVIRRRADSGEYGPGDPERHFAEQTGHDPGRPQLRRRRRPNGAIIDVRTTPLPDGGHLSVVTDVTNLMSAEAELSRRADVMDAMLANIRHGIILWDAGQRIVACNPVAAQMLLAPPGLLTPGRSLDEVTQSAYDRGNLGEGEIAVARARRLREQDRSKSHVDQRLTRIGRVLEVRTDPTPDGGFVTTYTDVTTIREAEEALRLAKSAAEAANTAKSRFLAAISHELRTPLSTIIGASGSLARAASDATKHGAAQSSDGLNTLDSAATINEAARRLLSMIDSILDVARLEAGRFDLWSDRVDIAALVRACVGQFDPAAAAAEVALNAELPDNLPAIRGDERRLRQALGHLVSNAVKFTGSMGSVTITAQQDLAGGGLLLQVADTGPGIPESDLERVFEPFTQLEQHRAADHDGRPAGTGLGLYISRALMRAHDGDVTLRSRPGQGTTAMLHIPASRVLHPGEAGLT